MNILPVNYQSGANYSPNFKANVWVERSVQKVIQPNRENFDKAVKNFDKWLGTEKKHVPLTLTIRKSTALEPKVAFEHVENKVTYAYPHEDTGYSYQELVKKYEDLEFQMGDRKSGFWFNPKSNAEKLLSDFKNMFNHLYNGK